jgi:hypothetical protein
MVGCLVGLALWGIRPAADPSSQTHVEEKKGGLRPLFRLCLVLVSLVRDKASRAPWETFPQRALAIASRICRTGIQTNTRS